MQELNVEEGKKIELNILLTIAEFCDRHNLRYFLTYGTLIGAIRHGGFIPWDDDVDITMPRKDYNEFLRLFNEEMKKSHYLVINPYDGRSRHSFAKVIDTQTIKIEPSIFYRKGEELGIDVDIFPLDGMPSDDKEYEMWYQKLYRIYSRYVHKIIDPRSVNSKIGKLKLLVRKSLHGTMLVTKKALLDKAAKLHSEYPYESSEYVGAMESMFNGKGNRVKKENFDDFVMVKFEEYSFKAPKGYHEILTSIYGDYMKLPPEEKRVTHHTNKIYLKENN